MMCLVAFLLVVHAAGLVLPIAAATAASLVTFALSGRPARNHIAGCLFIQDDGSRLPEWLAYHYHVLPLRRLVVLIGSRDANSLRPIFARWHGRMAIDLWTDDKLFSIAETANHTTTDTHRRLRAFNAQCMRELQAEGAGWTLVAGVDDYLYVNPRTWDPAGPLYQGQITPVLINAPGSVLEVLSKITVANDLSGVPEQRTCIAVSLLQLGALESLSDEVDAQLPQGLEPAVLARDLDTFRWRHHGTDAEAYHSGITPRNMIIDLSAIPEEVTKNDFTGDPNRPIRGLCPDPWSSNTETFLVANNVRETKQQYPSGNDSSLVHRILSWEGKKSVGGQLNDAVRPWLAGFVKDVGLKEARRLLANSGRLSATLAVDHLRCSINFFGRHQSFKTMALPSIVKNVLLINAKYNCDIFVHYYKMNPDEEGKDVDGGAIHSLKDIADIVAAHVGARPPAVVMRSETEEEFSMKYRDLVHRYASSTNPVTGKPIYFPWADPNYTSTRQIQDVVMQWNSIQSAWDAMIDHADAQGIEYQRIAFFGLDSFYALPVDIYHLDKNNLDHTNSYAVVPAFSKHPMNGRMIYGPADAVKIWATERFQRLEHHITTYQAEGYGMHPERFLGHEILPAIESDTSHKVVENMDICFYRTLAADSVMMSDCSIGGFTRGVQKLNQVALVEALVERTCQQVPLDTIGRHVELRCTEAAAGEAMAASGRYLLSKRSLSDNLDSPSVASSTSPSNLPSVLPSLSPSEAPSDTPSNSASRSLAPSSSPSCSPSRSPVTAENGSTYYTTCSGVCAYPVQSSGECEDVVAALMNASYKGSINNGNRPGGCHLNQFNAETIKFNNAGPKGTRCTPERQCVCLDPTPSALPSASLSASPSATPRTSLSPSDLPSGLPSISPSGAPSGAPSKAPSVTPSTSPSPADLPSGLPSISPSSAPSGTPSKAPSVTPSTSPSPSDLPSGLPSISFSGSPSDTPSKAPSVTPSTSPLPSDLPSGLPSISPSGAPSDTPSKAPSVTPSTSPLPSDLPSGLPSISPSGLPSQLPSSHPSAFPSVTSTPSNLPSLSPSGTPSAAPIRSPSLVQTVSPQPSEAPSDRPTFDPGTETMITVYITTQTVVETQMNITTRVNFANMILPNNTVAKELFFASVEETVKKTLNETYPPDQEVERVFTTGYVIEGVTYNYTHNQTTQSGRRLQEGPLGVEVVLQAQVKTTAFVTTITASGIFVHVDLNGVDMALPNATTSGTSVNNSTMIGSLTNPSLAAAAILEDTQQVMEAAVAQGNTTDKSTNATTSTFLTILYATVQQAVEESNDLRLNSLTEALSNIEGTTAETDLTQVVDTMQEFHVTTSNVTVEDPIYYPSSLPSLASTSLPSLAPSTSPSLLPSIAPSMPPTTSPSITHLPSNAPIQTSAAPTRRPKACKGSKQGTSKCGKTSKTKAPTAAPTPSPTPVPAKASKCGKGTNSKGCKGKNTKTVQMQNPFQ